MKILVVGGSGLVGSMVVPALTGRHEVTVADRTPPPWGGRFTQVDVRDPASMDAACFDHDAVVWLAMGPKADWGEPAWAVTQFDVNTTGLYVTLQAAARAGIRRAVVASTGSVFTSYSEATVESDPDAVDAYGLSKTCGELVARAASREHKMTVVALRLIMPTPLEQWRELDKEAHPTVVTHTAGPDVGTAFIAGIERDLPPGFWTPWLSGDHSGEFLDISHTTELLGWEPQHRK